MRLAIKIIATLLMFLVLIPSGAFTQKPDLTPPAYPNISRGIGRGVRGNEPTDKLTPELRRLYSQVERGTSRGRGDDESYADVEFSERDLR